MENITYKNSNVNRERQSKKFTCGMVEKYMRFILIQWQ